MFTTCQKIYLKQKTTVKESTKEINNQLPWMGTMEEDLYDSQPPAQDRP